MLLFDSRVSAWQNLMKELFADTSQKDYSHFCDNYPTL